MIDELRAVFDKLGYHSERIHFERAIPYPQLRERLSGPFSNTDVSQVLRHLPELFVMNYTMIHGIFFVKLLNDRGALEDEARATYEKFYPSDILLLQLLKSGKTTRIECRWIDEPNHPKSLIDALTSRFKFVPPKAAIDALVKDGWLV